MAHSFVSPAEINPLPDEYSFAQTPDTYLESTMEWSGTAQQAATALEAFLTLPSHSLAHIYWRPAHLARAVIDSPVQDRKRIDLVNAVTRLALHVYATGGVEEDLRPLSQSMREHRLLDTPIDQRRDDVTIQALQPSLIQGAAERLQEKVGDKAFMVPLCYGGFAAGVQVALSHRRNNPKSDTRIYPIRFSRRKAQDTKLHMSDAELEHIAAGAADRTLVVFDEDAYSGHTTGLAVQALRTQLPGQHVVGLSSKDERTSGRKKLQGVWWEHYDSSHYDDLID